jgi:hypothetical protein
VAAGDVNRDGFADIVIAPDAAANAGPLVEVFSGKALLAGVPASQAQLLPGFDAYDPAFHGGVRVAVGDTNGDGFADVITGPGFGGGPLVRVFSGKDGDNLLSFNAYASAFLGGIFVAAGDVNGDGKADILTGPGAGGGPLVAVFDGPTGNLLRSFNAYSPASLPAPGSTASPPGGVRVAAVDVNGDGKADILTGPAPGQPPDVKVFDAVTLAVIDDFFAYDPAHLGGVFVGAGK